MLYIYILIYIYIYIYIHIYTYIYIYIIYICVSSWTRSSGPLYIVRKYRHTHTHTHTHTTFIFHALSNAHPKLQSSQPTYKYPPPHMTYTYLTSILPTKQTHCPPPHSHSQLLLLYCERRGGEGVGHTDTLPPPLPPHLEFPMRLVEPWGP